MVIAVNSDFTGVDAPEVIVPPPDIPPAPAPEPAPAPTPTPTLPTIDAFTPTSTASGAVDEAPRGLPQAGVAPEDIGPIVEPHPQPTPAEPSAPTGGGTQAPTVSPTGEDGTPTAFIPLDDPTFDGFELAFQDVESSNEAYSSGKAKILRGYDFVRSVQQHASAYDLDQLATIANAMAEGINGAIGDSGHAFGPWQIWALDGRLPQFVGLPLYSPSVQAWAWTDNGIEYAMRSMRAGGASGKTGHAAVEQIVRGFERPADIPGAIRIRNANYDKLRGWGASVWDHVAQMAQGPSLGTAPPVTPRTEPTPTATPTVQIGDSWRGLMKALGSDMRFAASHASDTAKELAKGVRK